MSPRFVLGRENVPCVAEVVNRSLKADCTDFKSFVEGSDIISHFITFRHLLETRIFVRCSSRGGQMSKSKFSATT